ncbi:MAG: right-handed parallel beta-helix repeat-containing protein [Symplocastrum torsivum CPER-KK1]|uniref:Right-handed parallel beta-helix repeat-containing protein n=1 Tax=Symplocastrum torsivum CPER-KK1 TaxID=450513 RepID=A0A951UE64_9CYAN|nr:right-handed parallel beta-helix repeat-containing protein [Symplocastrum torsivum CPER-KK1]
MKIIRRKKYKFILVICFFALVFGLQFVHYRSWGEPFHSLNWTDKTFNSKGITGAQINESKIQQVIHVDINNPSASDKNPGLNEKPLKTFGAALEEAKQYLKKGKGIKILVHPGVYREGEFVINGKALGSKAKDALLVIEGAEKGKVILSGSDLWKPDTWKPVKDKTGKVLYYEHNWLYDFGNRGGAWGKYGPKQVIAHRSEMVFLNEQPLKQILLEKYNYTWPDSWGGRGNHEYMGLDEPKYVLKPGSFGVVELDENGNKIYIRPKDGLDFAKATVEVANKRFLLRFFHMENVVLRNLTFQHSNGEIEVDAAVMFGPWYGKNEFRGNNILIEDCNFLWNNARGLSLLNTKNVTLYRNTANYNGFMGIGVHLLINTIWENNETSFNNWRGYMGDFVSWAIGGAKIHHTRNGIFRGHQSIGNMTRGLWFDIANRNILIENLTAIHNICGLFLEISPGPFLVRKALVADDNKVNFLISNATNIIFENSIIHGVNGSNPVEFTSAKSRTFTDEIGEILGDNDGAKTPIFLGATRFENNIIIAGASNQALIVQDTGDPRVYREFLERGYAGSDNVYWAPEKKVFGLGFKRNRMTDIQGWANVTEEANYQWIDPQFVDPDNYDFRLQESSPLKDREDSLQGRKLSSAKVQELRNYLDFVGYERKKTSEVVNE